MFQGRSKVQSYQAAYVLQGFSTVFYVVFAVVFCMFTVSITVKYLRATSVDIYAGDSVASPSFLSLSPTIQKVAFGIALPNFLMAGALYAHTASSKLASLYAQ